MGIVNARADRLQIIERLPPIFHEVVVGENLAEVQGANLAEVIETQAIGTRHRRIDGRKLEGFRDEIFSEVGKTIVVGVDNHLRHGKAEHILPPIGNAIAVDIGDLLEVTILLNNLTILNPHACGEIAPIRFASSHLDIVTKDNSVPLDKRTIINPAISIIFNVCILLPPFRNAIKCRINSGVLPWRGRTIFIPHGVDILGERTAQRKHIVTLLVQVASSKLEARLIINAKGAVRPSIISLRCRIAVNKLITSTRRCVATDVART